MRSAKFQWFGVASVVFACLALLSFHDFLYAQTPDPSLWLVANNPTVEKIAEVDLTQPLPEEIIGNRDCQEREVVTRPRRYVAPLQSKTSHQACVIDAGYGAFAKSGYLQRANSNVYGELRSSTGGSTAFMAIPRSGTGLRLGGGVGYGTYAFFYDNLEESLTSSILADGTVTHRLPATYSAMLKDKSGNLLGVDSGSAGFSADGRWMVADLPFIGTARIDVQTREVLPFGDAPNYAVGLSVNIKTAISPDGRYAVVASKNFEIFKLYDLSTCGVVPSTITTKVPCSSRDLLPFIRQQIPGFTSVASMRLRSDYTVDLYANSITNNISKLTRYLVTAAGQQAPSYHYLALGDSFASGEGAYQYKASTDVTNNKCHLSLRSYPYLISSALGYGQSESVACSGAVIEDLVTGDKQYTGQAKDGKKLEDRNVAETVEAMLPGYIPQKLFPAELLPKVITVSAGGNDIGFSDIITRCIDSDTCYDKYEDRLMLAELVNGQFQPLSKMYNELKAANDPRAKIYVIGYPQVAAVDGSCDMNVHLNRDERVFAQLLISHLNGIIKKAAEHSGVFYVDVEGAFDGHKMCEATWSWETAVNGLTAGNDQINLPLIHGPLGNESYHPNALGHSLLKEIILEKTGNFTTAMPTPNPSAKANELGPTTPFLQVPKSNKTIRNLKHITGVEGGILKAGERWIIKASGLDLVFAGGSTLAGWLHSEPISLGNYIVSEDGTVTIDVNIPETIEPGWHTLHLLGKNSSGEDVDAFKTVYVDGGSTCLVPLSGQDADEDGTDDACDGFIDQPPVIEIPELTETTEPEEELIVELETPEEPELIVETPKTEDEELVVVVETPEEPTSIVESPVTEVVVVVETPDTPEREMGGKDQGEEAPETLALQNTDIDKPAQAESNQASNPPTQQTVLASAVQGDTQNVQESTGATLASTNQNTQEPRTLAKTDLAPQTHFNLFFYWPIALSLVLLIFLIVFIRL